MTTPHLIGLSGYAHSGKDTAAKALIDAGWQRRAFADTIRDVLYRLDPLINLGGPNPTPATPALARPAEVIRLSALVDMIGWGQAKNRHPEVRELLQRLGSDAGREVLGHDIWTRATLDNLPDHRVVITDVRLPAEANAIRARGGLVVRVVRPGTGPVNDHITEIAMDGYRVDVTLLNDGSVGLLHEKILVLAGRTSALARH